MYRSCTSGALQCHSFNIQETKSTSLCPYIAHLAFVSTVMLAGIRLTHTEWKVWEFLIVMCWAAAPGIRSLSQTRLRLLLRNKLKSRQINLKKMKAGILTELSTGCLHGGGRVSGDREKDGWEADCSWGLHHLPSFGLRGRNGRAPFPRLILPLPPQASRIQYALRDLCRRYRTNSTSCRPHLILSESWCLSFSGF